MIGFAAKALGPLLVFVGTLVGVVGLNPTTTPNVDTFDVAVLATRIIWTIGLAAIATGAGIKLRYVVGTPMTELPDNQARLLRAAQWRNSVTFIVALILLIWILTLLPV